LNAKWAIMRERVIAIEERDFDLQGTTDLVQTTMASGRRWKFAKNEVAKNRCREGGIGVGGGKVGYNKRAVQAKKRNTSQTDDE